MKQKIVVLLLLTFFILLSVAAYHLVTQRQEEIELLQKDQQVNQKQIADLNDRLAVLARQQQGDLNLGSLSGSSQAHVPLNAAQQLQLEIQRSELYQLKQQWVSANLNLAQDALFQSRFEVALALIQETQQHLIKIEEGHNDPLSVALLQAMKSDQQHIQQVMQQHRHSQLNIDRALSEIQQQLLQLSRVVPSFAGRISQKPASGIKSWFSKLIVVERVPESAQQQILDRNFVFKQSSLTLALARQALAQNDQVSLDAYLQEVLDLVSPFADADSRLIENKILAVQQQQLPSVKSLASLALVAHTKGAS